MMISRVMFLLIGGALPLVYGEAVDNDTPSPISYGEATFVGSGCSNGNVHLEMNEDEHTMRVIFGEGFKAQGGPHGRRARKTCNIAMPVAIAHGYSMAIKPQSSHGHVVSSSVHGEESASAKLSAELFFAGSHGPKVFKSFEAPVNSDFNLGTDYEPIWSECGASTLFRLNVALSAVGSGTEIAMNGDGYGFEFSVQVSKCGSNEEAAEKLQANC